MEYSSPAHTLGLAGPPMLLSSQAPSQAPSPEPTPPPSEPAPESVAQIRSKQPGHSRNYQACIPCRRRKVKCDLGPVDDPQDPPCARCKRESKTCFFSLTRRKRKPGDLDDEEEEAQIYIQDGNKRHQASMPAGHMRYRSRYRTAPGFNYPPITPGGGFGQPRPLRRPTAGADIPIRSFDGEEEQKINTETAIRLQHGELYDNHDALNLLAQTAAASGYTNPRGRTSTTSPPLQEFNGFGSGPAETPRKASFLRTDGGGRLKTDPDEEVEYQFTNPLRADALTHWQKLRFVRAGWFTAVEGVRYIEYFYRYMYPLTPITLPNFGDPSTHGKLLRDEPMLAITLLTIVTRHIESPTEGALLRNFAIHQHLWEFLQTMICRMIFGQDRIEHGALPFSQASMQDNRLHGLRGFGAIESLLLLTEWHPSLVHFPSHDFSNSILVEETETISVPRGTGLNGADADSFIGTSWRNPLFRSDDLTWSFIGLAVTLAYELGIFNGGDLHVSKDPKRAENVRRLLYIFATQTSGRLSLPSMIAESHWVQMMGNIEDVSKYIGKRASSEIDDDFESTQSPQVEEAVLHFWIKIGELCKRANNLIWPNRARARELVAQGNYADKLDKLTQDHQRWRHDFDVCSIIPSHLRQILDIEYYYMRVHCNNIALQAIVDRCVNVAPQNSDKAIPPEILEGCMGADRRYLDMIREDSKSLLHCVVHGLGVNGHLRHVSNRTFFRIANVSIILLKTLALGSYSDQLAECLNLLDQAAQMLADNAVDDLHVSCSFAELLHSMTGRIRSNIVRVSKYKGSRQEGRADQGGRPQSTPPTLQPHPDIGPSANLNGSGIPGSSGLNNNRVSGFGERRGQIHRPSPLGQHVDLPMPTPSFQQHVAFNNIANSIFNPDGSLKALTPNGTRSMSDPLEGIVPSSTFNAQNPDVSLMPPPPSARSLRFGTGPTRPDSATGNASASTSQGLNQTLAGAAQTPGLSAWSGFFNQSPQWANQDWVAMDLGPLSQAGLGEVRQTDSGPVVGNQDLLSLLTPSNPNGPPRSWGNFNNPNQQ